MNCKNDLRPGRLPFSPGKIPVLFSLLLVAFVIRYNFGHQRPWPPEKDAFQYDIIAQNLAAGEGFVDHHGQPTAFRVPLYPLFLAFLYTLFGRSHEIIVLAEALLGTGMVFLLYRIALKLSGLWPAVLSALLTTFYPALTFLYFGPGSLLSETLFLFLLVSVLYSLSRYSSTLDYKWLIIGALLLGLCALTRGTAALLPFFLVPWVYWINQGKMRSTRVRACFLFILVSLLPLVPWIIRNSLVFDSFVGLSTSSGVGFYRGNNLEAEGLPLSWPSHLDPAELEGMNEVEQARYLARKGRKELWQEPGRVPRLLLRKLLMLWDPFYTPVWGSPTRWNGLYLWALPFFLTGLLTFIRSAERQQTSFAFKALMIVLYFTLITLIYYGDIRSRSQFEPALLVFFGPGVITIWQKWQKKGRWIVLSWSAAVVLLTFFT